MSAPVEPTAEAIERLVAEAERRGTSVEIVIAELAARPPSSDPLESFIGCGASGDTRPFDIHRERSEQADRKLATGI